MSVPDTILSGYRSRFKPGERFAIVREAGKELIRSGGAPDLFAAYSPSKLVRAMMSSWIERPRSVKKAQ